MSTESTSVRGTIKNFLAKLLLGFLVITFAVWGIGDILNPSAEQTVATVGDARITVPEFQNELRFQQAQMKDQLPDTLLNSGLFRQQVLQRLVQNNLFLETAHDAGIYVSEDIVAKQVRTSPQYQDIRGNFDPALYQSILQANRMTEAQFLRDMRDAIGLQLMLDTLQLPPLTASEGWQTVSNMLANERRNVVLVHVEHGTMEDTLPAPSEEAMRAAYERNADAYMEPEKRDFTLAVIAPSAVKQRAKESITEQDVRNALDAQGAQDTPENRAQARTDLLASHVEEAGYVLSIMLEDALAAGAPLRDALMQSNVTADITTIRDVAAVDIAEGTAANANFLRDGFAMAEGDVSPLRTTKEGRYYLVQLDSITLAQPKPFDAVKDQVRRRLIAQEKEARLQQKAQELRVQLSYAENAEARTAVLRDAGVKSESLTLTRGDGTRQKHVSASLRAAIFNAEKGEVLGPFGDSSTHTHTLAVVTDIALPSVSDIASSNNDPDGRASLALQQYVDAALFQTMQAEHPVQLRMRLSEEGQQ
jgi:peptidyl-prolyl cis-trans isomerase D